ncbi:CDP-alcohol phosphatidyltransferase family protein [Sphingomonas sp. RS2018]
MIDRPARPIRPPELQDALNARLYHPLAWQLARLISATPVTPNMVSVFGCLMLVATTAAYAGLPWPVSVAIGLACHMSWHVVDGADGDLARMTGRTSPLGEMIDGASDYLGHVILYVVLTIQLSGVIGGGAAWALAIAAGASHAVQTNHAESQKRVYQWWAYGVPWLKQSGPVKRTRTGVLGGLATLYLTVALRMNRSADAVDAALAAASPERLERMRTLVRSRGRALLAWSKLVGPNPRAFILAAAMLVADVRWFFVAEIVVLNLVLVASVMRQRRQNRALAAELAGVI